MSDSAGEKTEQPTPKKLEGLRKKGQVPQSQDVNKLFVTLVGIELFITMHDSLLADIKRLFDISFQLQKDPHFTKALSTMASEGVSVWMDFIVILLLAVIIARFFGGFVQFGFLMAPEALNIDFKKFDPVSNTKNMLSKKKMVELLSNIIKAIALTIIFSQVIRGALPYILLLPDTGLESSIAYSVDIFSYISHLALAFFLVIAGVDFKLQKDMFTKQQMMTKDEVFREYKQTEGDPFVKGMRKALGKQLANSGGGNVKKSVKKADAVVVNPTHFAVAVEYKPGKTMLPVIRAKGVDDRAKQIIEYARENEIPVVRHIMLARYLFRAGQEDKYIPRPSMQDMAIVFRAIMEAKAKGEVLDEFHDLTDAQL